MTETLKLVYHAAKVRLGFLITACAISKEDIWEVTKVNIWYIGVMVLVLVLVTYFPMLSLWPLKVFY